MEKCADFDPNRQYQVMLRIYLTCFSPTTSISGVMFSQSTGRFTSFTRSFGDEYTHKEKGNGCRGHNTQLMWVHGTLVQFLIYSQISLTSKLVICMSGVP